MLTGLIKPDASTLRYVKRWYVPAATILSRSPSATNCRKKSPAHEPLITPVRIGHVARYSRENGAETIVYYDESHKFVL